MAIEQRSEEFVRDSEYADLKTLKTALENRVQTWVNRATALHAASDPATNTNADAADQADIIAMRDEFVVNLSAILGV